MERFSRIIQLLGEEKFNILRNKKVTIIGLGAVGGFAAEGLARSGISNFRLVDFDKISRSNINRHVAALESTVGKTKVSVISERIKDINPEALIEEMEIFAHRETFDEIFDNSPDLIVDAIDSLGPKIELLAYIHQKNLNGISSMGAALRTDPLKIKTADLFETDVCPLARNLRKYLRRKGISSGIKCVYSYENPVKSGLRPPEEEESSDFIRGRERNIMGSYPAVTAVFGLIIADYGIKNLLSRNSEKKE